MQEAGSTLPLQRSSISLQGWRPTILHLDGGLGVCILHPDGRAVGRGMISWEIRATIAHDEET